MKVPYLRTVYPLSILRHMAYTKSSREVLMEYEKLIQSIQHFSCIGGEQKQADAAVKACMGVLASRMTEQDAKEFSNYLPEPLTLASLRNHEPNRKEESLREFFQLMASRFNTDEEEAQKMVEAVLHTAKESLRPQQLNSWREKLPSEWASFLTGL